MTSTLATRRSTGLDVLRGWAVLLMLLDHLLLVAGIYGLVPEGSVILRQTVTRFAMPAFLGLSGYLYALRGAPSPRRSTRVALAGLGLSLLTLATSGPFDTPSILVLAWATWTFLGPTILRYPAGAVALSLPLAMNLPLPDWWAGFGLELVTWFAFGVLLHRLYPAGHLEVPTSAPVSVHIVGRHALPVYVAHVATLDVLLAVS